MREVNNSEDILDSRDVIARRDYLRDERQSLEDAITELEEGETDDDGNPMVPPCAQAMGCLCAGHAQGNRASSPCETNENAETELGQARAALVEWNAGDEAEELRDLEAFIAEGSPSWEDGETLIRESYFEDYAQELADDLHGERMAKNEWPFSCIDWERAARELRYDYTGADFDGVTYYYRA